jgi:hypothetical protein
LKNSARALTDLETKPAISQLARQIARTNDQGQAAIGQVGGFYNQFGDRSREILDQQRAITDSTNQTLAGIASQSQGQIAQAGQQGQEALQPLVDKGLDGGSFARLAAEMAAQQGLAAQNGQTFRSFGATQGGNFEGLTAGSAAAGQQRGVESLGELANAFARATEEPRAKIAELRANRGALMTKNVGALRDSERNYGLAVGALGLDQQELAASIEDDRADRAVALRGQDLVARAKADASRISEAGFVARYGITPEGLARLPNPGQWLKNNAPTYARAGARGARPLTPSQRNEAWGQIDAAKSAIEGIRQSYPDLTTKQIRQALTTGAFEAQDEDSNAIKIKAPRIKGGGYGDFANTAMDLVINGRISRENIKALHRAGLRIGRRYDYERNGRSKPQRFNNALGLGG